MAQPAPTLWLSSLLLPRTTTGTWDPCQLAQETHLTGELTVWPLPALPADSPARCPTRPRRPGGGSHWWRWCHGNATRS